MRTTPGRSRRNRREETGTEPAQSVAPAAVTWDELSETERTALKRMNRGPYSGLPPETGRRLIEMGLAVSRAAGIGISRSGRELVISRLLEARREDDGS